MLLHNFTQQLVNKKISPFFPEECEYYLFIISEEVDKLEKKLGRTTLSTEEMIDCVRIAKFATLMRYVGQPERQKTIVFFDRVCRESLVLSEANGMNVKKAVDEAYAKYQD